jgi:hypothetical protein
MNLFQVLFSNWRDEYFFFSEEPILVTFTFLQYKQIFLVPKIFINLRINQKSIFIRDKKIKIFNITIIHAA